MRILGVDPGKSGGFALSNGEHAEAYDHHTPQEIVALLRSWAPDKAYLEQVGAFPGQGVVSCFHFGENYGWWQGVLTSLGIPFERVTPIKWQTKMGCRTGGDKNISKQKAQELWPKLKITHATADALLIAEYGRRVEAEL
jgi:crossover junction endodeoxyribonuclease RuvC